MSKRLLVVLLAAVFFVLVGLYVYSDYFGNPKMQENVGDLLKVIVGAVAGAWANEHST
jgi:hypothetical protein